MMYGLEHEEDSKLAEADDVQREHSRESCACRNTPEERLDVRSMAREAEEHLGGDTCIERDVGASFDRAAADGMPTQIHKIWKTKRIHEYPKELVAK